MSDNKNDRRIGPWKMGGFDLDGTLILGSTVLIHVGRRLGRLSEAKRLIDGYESFRLSNFDVSVKAAKMFCGLTRQELILLMEDVPRLADIGEVVNSLKRQNVRLIIATISFEFAGEWFARKYGFDNYAGIVLEFDRSGRATGEIVRHMSEHDKAEFVAAEATRHDFSLDEVFYVGDSRSDLPTFKRVGFSVAINGSPEARASAHRSVNTTSLRAALDLVPRLFGSPTP